MSKLTNQEAIAIFQERMQDLEQYKDADPEIISDGVLKEKIRFRKSIYELNARLYEIFTGRNYLQ